MGRAGAARAAAQHDAEVEAGKLAALIEGMAAPGDDRLNPQAIPATAAR